MAAKAYTHTPSAQLTRDYDGRIIAGYCVLGIIALAALYFGAAGPGSGGAALALMVAMP
jgi:hypothetical protein